MAPFAPVSFVLDPEGNKWRDFLSAAGFEAASGDDGDDGPVAGAVVDHYDPAPGMAEHWRKRAAKLVVFRDHSQTIANADIEIRQWAAHSSTNPSILSGLEYAIVDPGYADIREVSIRALPAHVLVAFGMRDTPNATALILAAVETLAPEWQPRITVALGADAPHVLAVRCKVDELGDRARLVLDATDLQDELADCDLAVGAGGVSAVERAAAGRPSLTIALNSSQAPVASALAAVRATHDCGLVQRLSVESIADTLRSLAGDADRRAEMAQSGRRAVDGLGPQRTANALIARQLL